MLACQRFGASPENITGITELQYHIDIAELLGSCLLLVLYRRVIIKTYQINSRSQYQQTWLIVTLLNNKQW